MFYKTTQELEKYITDIYDRVKPVADKDSIYKPLGVYFAEGTPQNIEGMYCYSDNGDYHYCGTERGRVNMHNITRSLFELSYWILKDQVFMMAIEFEHRNRIAGQDGRKLIFQKELELLEVLGENYKKRIEIDIDERLKQYPYQDIQR